MALERLLSVDDAAKALGGISKWTVHAWLSQGKLRRTKIGSRTMIRASELGRIIKDGAKSPCPARRQQSLTKKKDASGKSERK